MKTIKPRGTTSVLKDTTDGVHQGFSAEYLRKMRPENNYTPSEAYRAFSTIDTRVANFRSITAAKQVEPTFTFFNTSNLTEVMRLDNKGMVYKGVRIVDAGEAYKAFMETMQIMKGNK